MSIENLSDHEVKNMSLIKLAKFILSTERKSMKFTDIFEQVSELKGLSSDLKQDKLSQFYTDLNVDGNFIKDGGNTWGLKRWYGGQKKIEDSATTVSRNRGSSRTNKVDIDFDEVDLEEFELLDESIDDIDEDELVEDFDDEDVDYAEDFDKVEAD